jgi:hypothetical protein
MTNPRSQGSSVTSKTGLPAPWIRAARAHLSSRTVDVHAQLLQNCSDDGAEAVAVGFEPTEGVNPHACRVVWVVGEVSVWSGVMAR